MKKYIVPIIASLVIVAGTYAVVTPESDLVLDELVIECPVAECPVCEPITIEVPVIQEVIKVVSESCEPQIVRVEVPVEIIKEVIKEVEVIREVEKIIYRDKIVYQDRVVYQDVYKDRIVYRDAVCPVCSQTQSEQSVYSDFEISFSAGNPKNSSNEILKDTYITPSIIGLSLQTSREIVLKKLEEKNKFFPPNPSIGSFCSIGGMLGNNSSGSRSLKYGSVIDNVIEITFIDGNGVKITPPQNKRVAKKIREF